MWPVLQLIRPGSLARGITFALIASLVLGFVACSREVETGSGSYFGALPPDAVKRLGKGQVSALAFAPGAGSFVVGSEVGLYSYQTDPVTEGWASPAAAGVTSMAFDPEGEIIAVGLKNQVLILLDASTGQPLPGSTALRAGEVTALEWSAPDASSQRLLAIGFSNGAAALARIASSHAEQAEILFSLDTARGGVTSLAFSPGGEMLAVGDSNGGLTLWNVATGQPLKQLVGHGNHVPVTALLWYPDGSTLISGGKRGKLIAWDWAEGSVRNQSQAYPEAVAGLGWLAGEGVLQSISAEGELKTWQPDLEAAGAEILEGTILAADWSADGGLLLIGSDAGSVGLWETGVEAGNALLTSLVGFNAPGEVASTVAWSRNGDRLAAGHGKQIYIWKAADLQHTVGQGLGAPAAILSGHEGSDTAISWAPDGKTLATGGRDQRVILWNPESGEILHQLEGHRSSIWGLAWSPDGQRLASTGGLDDRLILWNARSGEQLAALPGDTYGLFGLAWSPDGRSLAAGTGYGRVLIWDVSQERIGDPYASWFGHLSWVGGVSWAPDGLNLASGSADRTIVVWDVLTGRKRHTLTGHTDAVLDVAFEANGERLASASADGLVIVWKLFEDTAVVLPGHTQAVGGVDWSPESVLASGSADGTVIFWDADRSN